MKPIVSFGPVELSTYALMLSLGACAGFWLTRREIERRRLDAGRMFALAAIAFAAGLIGARGLSFLLHAPIYRARPWWSFFFVWDRGGLSMYGGLVLAALVGLLYIRLARLPAWDTADLLVWAWTPFLFFLRIGCFLNGCCYGRPTTSAFGLVPGGAPNSVTYGIPSHPAQLYAAAALLAIFGILSWMRPRRRFAGQLTVSFLSLYSTFVFFHEFLRGDNRPAWRVGLLGVLTFNQLASLLLLVLALAAGYRIARRDGISGSPVMGEPERA
jgi:phosphatidylglycerol:prolipoprotein diacylglycerol transferase